VIVLLWVYAVPKNPSVGFFQYKLDKWDVIAAEARGFIPDAVLPKEADNCD
jgi:hypothetical protein